MAHGQIFARLMTSYYEHKNNNVKWFSVMLTNENTQLMVFNVTYIVCGVPKLYAWLSQSVMSAHYQMDIICQHK